MQNEVNTLIKNALAKSISYDAYVELMNRLALNHETTGDEKTEALINYTQLNQRRMKRWNKTIKVDEGAVNRIQTIDQKFIFLVITESWCGDAAHVIPAVQKLIAYNPNIEMRLVFRDENPSLMDAFLTNGSRSIAKFILLDADTKEVVNTYGPRPSEATALVAAYKAKHGQLTPQFKEDLQRWYNKDKGQTTINDVLMLFAEVMV